MKGEKGNEGEEVKGGTEEGQSVRVAAPSTPAVLFRRRIVDGLNQGRLVEEGEGRRRRDGGNDGGCGRTWYRTFPSFHHAGVVFLSVALTMLSSSLLCLSREEGRGSGKGGRRRGSGRRAARPSLALAEAAAFH
jgi:hypothetical protein